ncbi:MAG: helix-turn-helix domain-containing protein [Oceanisphaera sp.]|uniref:helix-turn-helix domain-containing protein n=1 Tax=Oceanisphaera sp. TaxID=1929979 RepID=UPI003C78B353
MKYIEQTKSARILDRRLKLKLTQQQLAEAIGVSYQAVQQWEAGKSAPKGARLNALTATLKCSKVWLEFGENTALGERIRALMVERDWSEGELSRRSGINQPTIHRIITGASREPRASNLDKIAEALDVAPEHLRDQGGWYHKDRATAKGSPMLSWNVVGTEIQEGAVSEKQHYICPVPCSEYTFVLQVQAISMEPLFRDNDLIFIDPAADVRHGSYIVARLDDHNEATFKQLIIEGGQKYLKPINPSWPEQIIPINGNCTIVGPVVFSGRVF